MMTSCLRHSRICILIVFCLFSLSSPGWPKAPSELQTIQLFYENDLFAGTDEYYTNAFQITWLSSDLSRYEDDVRLPAWSVPLIEAIPFSGHPGSIHNVGILFGQQIYTPSNTQATAALENDRPYAGFLYTGLALHSKTDSKLDTMEIVFGVVGPDSKAEAVQNTVHDVRGIPTAKGWDNQLHNEPALRLSWQRKWRLLVDRTLWGPMGYDVISRAGITLGNVRTSTNAGGELRFGYHIPEDFGSDVIHAGAGVSAPVIRDSKPGKTSFGVHMFVGSQIEAVAHDIFLDGNTWRHSQCVDKKPLVADLSLGVSVSMNMFKLTYRHLFRTKEFDNQGQGHSIGSLTLALSF